jgi:S-formylglutathione hydrolase
MRVASAMRPLLSGFAASTSPQLRRHMTVAMSSAAKQVSSWKAHGGHWTRHTHDSSSTGGQMTFSVFTPPGATADAPAPVLFYLSGLTCTDENVVQKCGASRAAALHGVALVCPDTSPRGAGIDGEDDSWDFGTGAGFYVDATKEPWSDNYNMYSYVTKELRGLVTSDPSFGALDGSAGRMSVTGHSMGGHGALTIAFKEPSAWASVSAFAPICHPTNCPWGEKAFGGYLAGGVEEGESHDAVLLLQNGDKEKLEAIINLPILVDQGSADSFLPASEGNGPAGQLQRGALKGAMMAATQRAFGRHAWLDARVRTQPGYDHSYFFMSSFIDEHIEWHAGYLKS